MIMNAYFPQGTLCTANSPVPDDSSKLVDIRCGVCGAKVS